MAKKRGGLAGFYDRNKKIIKPVAAGLAGLVGTPALGAAVGAAFGGLDREGKRGIGFDALGAAKGGLEGYAAGSAGQSLGSMTGKALGKAPGFGKISGLEKAGNRLSGLFTGGGNAASKAQAVSAGAKSPVGALNAPTDFADISDIGSKYVTQMPTQMPPLMKPDLMSAVPSRIKEEGGNRIAGMFKGASGYIDRNKTVSELALKGLLSQLPSEEAAIGRGNLDLNTRKLDMQQAQIDEDRRRREYVMQYLRQQYPQYFQNG